MRGRRPLSPWRSPAHDVYRSSSRLCSEPHLDFQAKGIKSNGLTILLTVRFAAAEPISSNTETFRTPMRSDDCQRGSDRTL